MEFYNNTKNTALKFKMASEGINVSNLETRLILINKKSNSLYFGKVENDICVFNIPQLEQYNKGEKGTVKFEIISDENYFKVWEDTFEIITKPTVKIEQLVNDIIEEHKPKLSVKPIIEEPKKEEKITIEKEDEVIEESIEELEENEGEEENTNTIEEVVDVKKSSILDFETFFKK
jgi:hypothetical protein